MVAAPHREGGQAQFVKPAGAGRRPARWSRPAAGRPSGWASHSTSPRCPRHAGVSPRTFARRFRAETGTTPLQWLLSQRVLEARRLLEETDLPVEAVAWRCGFGTAASLRDHFRRATATTPTAYRRAFQARRSRACAAIESAPMSRRDQIVLSDAELAELLESERVAVVSSLGPRGWPHSMPLWFVPRDGRDLDLDLRQVAEGPQPRTRPAGDGAGRDRPRVRRAARGDDRGRGRDPPRLRDRDRLRRRADAALRRRGSPRSRGTPRRRWKPRRRSGSRSASRRCAPPPGTTASSAAPTERRRQSSATCGTRQCCRVTRPLPFPTR